MDLTLDRWKRITASEREAIARQLAASLPSGFAFEGLKLFRLGAVQYDIAMFSYGAADFAYVPGGTVTIGFDANRCWTPKSDELESWQGTAEEYGIEKSLEEYVLEATLRRR